MPQFREAIPCEHDYRFVIVDRDTKFPEDLRKSVRAMGVRVLRTPPFAPQANSYCERLIGSTHREYLDFLIPVLFFTLNREDFSFVIHLDRQPRTSRRREAQTGSRARSGSRSERTLDAVEHSRTLMEWWPFLIFHRGGLRIKVINNTRSRKITFVEFWPIGVTTTIKRGRIPHSAFRIPHSSFIIHHWDPMSLRRRAIFPSILLRRGTLFQLDSASFPCRFSARSITIIGWHALPDRAKTSDARAFTVVGGVCSRARFPRSQRRASFANSTRAC